MEVIEDVITSDHKPLTFLLEYVVTYNKPICNAPDASVTDPEARVIVQVIVLLVSLQIAVAQLRPGRRPASSLLAS